MVLLPDGRRRSILRSITDLAVETFGQTHDSIEESLRVSVRTLLPLARFLALRSPSFEEIGDEHVARLDADTLDEPRSGIGSVDSSPTPTVGEPLRGRQDADGVRRRRYGQTDGSKTTGGAR
jgi:hypothetical protein